MRQQVNRPACNWNTYSGLGFNRLLKLPERYELRVSAFLPAGGFYTSRFFFSADSETGAGLVVRVFNHSPYGEYVRQVFDYRGHSFEFTFTGFGEGELALSCRPLARGRDQLRLLVELRKIWDEGQVDLADDGTVSLPLECGDTLRIGAIQEGFSPAFGLYAGEAELIEGLRRDKSLNGARGRGRLAALLFEPDQPFIAAAARGPEVDFQQAVDLLQEAARAHGGDVLTRGLFSGSLETLNTATNCQIVWDDVHGCFYTPVTRRWIDFYLLQMGLDPEARGPVLGLWDCLFAALLHSCQNLDAAEGNLRALFNDDIFAGSGFPPNYIAHPIKSGDRSQPPLGALAAWKVYCKHGDRRLLEDLYPYLLQWHRWWPAARDGNGDGLLEWGSDDNVPAPGNDAGTLFGAKCESGMDNSPLFDDAVFDYETKVMNLNSVFLNSVFAADCLYLAKIAALLGRGADRRSLEAEYERIKEKINVELWSEEAGIYLDRFWDGSFSHRIAPPCFFPMLARVPTPEQAERMVRGYLTNDKHFWGEFLFPSISKSDPAFAEQLYWRGRIWPPLNYLVYAGLKEYGFDDIAAVVALKSYRLFMREWHEKGHCHENYSAVTGLGCDVPGKQESYDDGFMGNSGSDPFYTWGALLLLPAVEELADADPGGGLRFGSAFLESESILERISLGGSEFRVAASAEKLEVQKDGALLIAAVPGVNVRRFTAGGGRAACLLKGAGSTTLQLRCFDPSAAVRLTVEGDPAGVFTCNGDGEVFVELGLDGTYREYRFDSSAGS